MSDTDIQRLHERAQTAARVSEALRDIYARNIHVVDQTRARSEELVARSKALREALRAVTLEYARVFRQEERPPEAMLVELKKLLRDVPAERILVSRSILEDVVTWSLESYYAGAGADD